LSSNCQREYLVMSKINLIKHNRKSNVETPANIARKNCCTHDI